MIRHCLDRALPILALLLLMVLIQEGPTASGLQSLLIMLLCVLPINGGLIWFHCRDQDAFVDQAPLIRRLEQEGQRITVHVRSVEPSAAFINMRPVVRMQIEYRHQERFHRKTLMRQAIGEPHPGIQPGRHPALIDPKRPQVILLL